MQYAKMSKRKLKMYQSYYDFLYKKASKENNLKKFKEAEDNLTKIDNALLTAKLTQK